MPAWLRFLLGGVCAANVFCPLRASNAEALVTLFQPDRIVFPALAPDGRHLAYVVRENAGDKIVPGGDWNRLPTP